MKKCNFCGNEKNPATKTILIESENGQVICNHCISKSMLLIKDEGYEDEPVINIKSPLTNSVA